MGAVLVQRQSDPCWQCAPLRVGPGQNAEWTWGLLPFYVI